MDFSDLLDYCEAAIYEETDLAVQMERLHELDALRIHLSPVLPALARLLHDEPGLVDAVEAGYWSLYDHEGSPENYKLLKRLAVVLATKEDGDGQT